MSGRKSSEVAGVLEQGEKVRKLTDELYSQQIQNDKQELMGIVSKIEELLDKNNGLTADLSEAAASMFGEDGQKLVGDFCVIKDNMAKITLPKNAMNMAEKELARLDGELIRADAEAEQIRTAIRGKRNGWYCDEEYAAAKKLLKVYQKLRDERLNLQHNMTKQKTDTQQILHALSADVRQMEKLQKQISDMNTTAKKRLEAEHMREELRNLLQAIPADNAKKFFDEEYAKLVTDTEKKVQENDDAVLASFNIQYGVLSGFIGKLQKRVEEWTRQKADAEGLIHEVEKLADFDLIGPVEYYNDGENGSRTELFAYLKEYAQKDLRPQYEKKLHEAKSHIEREEFIDAMTPLNEAAAFIQGVRDEAIALQDAMLKKTELAGTIQDVMEGLRYDINTEFIDDNPNNGYRITCTAGDEIIDFDCIDIDDDGKIIMKIDHTEAMGGTCGASWQEIAKKLQDAGIPVTNVTMENGRSILRQQKKGINAVQGQIRKH